MKRLFDFIASLVAIIVFLPLIVVVALLIRWKIGLPIIFKQMRPGLNEKPIFVYKFRTMTDQCDETGHLLPSEQRLTSFGRFLRKLSLDELPQLWNVLKGDMSLIGPRPLLMEYLPFYDERQSKRHLVRPGITGWAQVNGRNLLSWEEKFEFDVWYVENQTFWLDIKILYLTLLKVLKSEGVNPTDKLIMEMFTGTSKQTPQ